MPAVTLSPYVVAPAIATKRRAIPGLARLRSIVRQSRRHGLWIAAWSIVGWAGTALAPALASKPFLVMLLAPRALFVALASDSVSIVPFVLLGTLRLSITDASYYIIGRRLPQEIRPPRLRSNSTIKRAFHAVASRTDRLCRWFCARPRLAGAFLFFRPNGKYLAVAGAYGVRPWLAGLSATAGTAIFLGAMHVGVGAIF